MHPVNKKYFSGNNPLELAVVTTSAWIAGASAAETGFAIVRQTGWNRYIVIKDARIGTVYLVNGAPTKAGEASIEVTPFGSSVVEYARTIQSRNVKTFADKIYSWSLEAATEEGFATLPTVSVVPFNEAEMIEAFAAATSGAEMLALIKQYGLHVADEETLSKFDDFPNDSGRQEAVGDGVAEWATLVAPITTSEIVAEYVKLHVDVEFEKAEFIAAIDSAANAAAMRTAFNGVSVLVARREAMIDELAAVGTSAATARAQALSTEKFTTVLNDLAEKIAADEDLSTVAADMLAARNARQDQKFYGIVPIVDALEIALA